MTRTVFLVVMSILAACGGDEGRSGLPDASSSDGAIADAPSSTSVIMTVTRGGVALQNQTVYFQSPDSSVTVTRMTDADGNATADVEAGGYVTVIDPQTDTSGRFTNLSTIADVQPGDHLYINISEFDPDAGVKVNVTVSVPDEGLGYTYELFATCGFGEVGKGSNEIRRQNGNLALAAISNTITLTDCAGIADMLVVGIDADRIVRSWAYQAGVAVSDGGAVEFTRYEQPIDVIFTYTFASLQGLQVQRSLETAHGFLYDASVSLAIDGTGSTMIAMPSPPGVTTRTSSFARPGNEVHDWGGGNDNYSLDFQAVAPNRFANSSFDIPTRKVMWTETSDGTVPDFAVASYESGRSDENGRRDWSWRIAGAYRAGQSTLSYPTLPATLYDFNPRASDEVRFGGLHLVKNPGGYAAARPRLFTAEDIYAKEGLMTGASGRLVDFVVDRAVNPE
jgi:hypothetical protein